jgi:hypothetical protein
MSGLDDFCGTNIGALTDVTCQFTPAHQAGPAASRLTASDRSDVIRIARGVMPPEERIPRP